MLALIISIYDKDSGHFYPFGNNFSLFCTDYDGMTNRIFLQSV